MPLAVDRGILHHYKPYHAYPSSSLHTVEASGPFMQYLGSGCQVTAVLDIADLHCFGSCRGCMISL